MEKALPAKRITMGRLHSIDVYASPADLLKNRLNAPNHSSLTHFEPRINELGSDSGANNDALAEFPGQALVMVTVEMSEKPVFAALRRKRKRRGRACKRMARPGEASSVDINCFKLNNNKHIQAATT